ncbi:MAG TPA: diacylglycerol kinase family protein [Actinomycetota bacterium]|nr:diacylglycerol kinase family protein [Actinomycetota bacterium]
MTAACVAHVGSSAWQDLPAALAVLRGRFGRVPVHPAGEPGDAETLASELAGEVDVLLVFGGDGTVHEVANGLPLPAGQDGPLVGLLPAGTGNDLARALGLPPDPVAAARALLDGRPRPIDMLDCGPRRAANGINAGFAAAATDVLSRPVKRALGPAAYVVGGVWAGLWPPTWPARVDVEGRVVDGEALAVVVGNGGSFGGGRWLLPDADVGDGLLDVLVVPAAASRAKLARTLAMDRRLPDDLPRLRGPAATVVTGMPCRLDGEPAPTPGSVAVIPGAWRVLAPSSG